MEHGIYYHTKHFQLGRDSFCSYCGKKCTSITEFDRYEIVEEYYRCDCYLAIRERELQEKVLDEEYNHDIAVSDLEKLYPEIDKDMIRKMQYEHELKGLQNKYNMIPENILFRKFQ